MIPFVIEHHLKATRKNPPLPGASDVILSPLVEADGQSRLVFETCMRRMIIHPWGEGPENEHQLSGAEAYAFLLEVLTGIQSPVFGETEVFAQFKEFWLQSQALGHAQFFAPWAKSLIEDTKRVRSEFFRAGTTQTWGGVVRRSLRPYPEVWIIGNGELALSVAAALKEKETVFWARQEKAGLPGRHHAWGQAPTSGAAPRALVICAPLSDEEVRQLAIFKEQAASTPGEGFSWIADLREVSSARQSFIDFNLKDVEAQTEEYRQRTEEIRLAAQSRILELSEKSVDALWHRPMGWEDLCG